VAEVELDRRIVRPLEAVHAELLTAQLGSRRNPSLSGTQSIKGAVAEEDELSTGAEQPCRFGYPAEAGPPRWQRRTH